MELLEKLPHMHVSLSQRETTGELLTVRDAASYLKVSRITIWRWCNSGRLPAFKIGREWRIHRGALDAIVLEHIQWQT